MAHPVKLLGALLGLALLCSGAAGAQETQWQKDHPRRAETNKRLGKQNKRIQQGVKSGELDKSQARQLHQEDKAIHKQERQDAAKNGGHITRQQKKQLNQEENQTSKQIHQEKHPAAP